MRIGTLDPHLRIADELGGQRRVVRRMQLEQDHAVLRAQQAARDLR